MIHEKFLDMLVAGGHTNSLGRTSEVITLILQEPQRMEELYNCLFADDAWVRMRAADALEKVCREHPDWLLSFMDRCIHDVSVSTQPSIQWHLAQIYGQVTLTPSQKELVLAWLKQLISTPQVDWIVSANTMKTLAHFTHTGDFPRTELLRLLAVQRQHKSNAVKKRAQKHLDEFSNQA